MRTLPLVFLLATAGFCQDVSAIPVAPVPPDPLELVTGPTQVPATPAERGALVQLLLNATEKYAMHERNGPAHVLQVSFNATSSTLYPGGAGQLRETWISGQTWRWDGALGNYSLLRISSNAAIYDQTPNSTIPLRFKMLASAIFNPIEAAPRRATLRSTTVSWKGTQITCIMTSGQENAQVGAQGRQWYEKEFCIDPATGLLNIASLAPGVYSIYDYSNALQFHGRVLPGKVTICENGTTVIDAQLTSIADIDPKDTTPFTPTAQMVAQGTAMALGTPERFALPGVRPQAPGNTIQPAIVHVTLDPQGRVLESEVLQTSAVSAAALSLVNEWHFGAMKTASGAPPIEREAYINVRFQPRQ